MKRFPIRIERRSRLLLRLFGVRADRSAVILEAGQLVARFGFSVMRTPLSNVAGWRIEGPFRWLTAIGVRRSVRHGDVTFGGSTHGGVRLDFRDRVRWNVFRVPALYVTVDDLEGFASELTRLGIEGTDARTRGPDPHGRP